jgi:hypothetical protein
LFVLFACRRDKLFVLIDKFFLIPYKIFTTLDLSGRNSAVECQLPKLDVAGSIPVARSKISHNLESSIYQCRQGNSWVLRQRGKFRLTTKNSTAQRISQFLVEEYCAQGSSGETL